MAQKPHCLAVVLAAGLGTRMKSELPKVLHEIGGLPLVGHVMQAVNAAGADRTAVVVGPDMPQLEAVVAQMDHAASTYVQVNRQGTADALRAAEPAFSGFQGDVLVVFGDTPLVQAQSFALLREKLSQGAALAVLGFEAKDPTGYGRLLMQGDELVAIREHKDASEAERQVTLCNAGIMAFKAEHLQKLLAMITNDNANEEFYLTDAVEHAVNLGLSVVVATAPEEEVQGINNRAQLAACEAVFQTRKRTAAMLGGVTLQAPETVYFSYDTQLAPDVLVEPNVVFGPAVEVASGASIRAFSHLEHCNVAAQATIGPYARLRPGANIGEGARIGNFVEIKNAEIAQGAKVNHLSYIGDASIGSKTNIGAGTITCNYDGYLKHKTQIGENCFIGSNSILVAPLSIGDGVTSAAGSTLTRNVPQDALAIARPQQENKEGAAPRIRARLEAKKRAKTK
ncbi:bifunctional UDP-N-acetylglucosamine diphosphorylase/glucosamine-1-phosphate N-acetyltransferase GlmU [Polycladidibacter hongkongensis]|uniref:bifunctional UDP-N-acetylglucosamine diphosphorylase/glucosamine-1-phosphate N-acetyltransferase GlmU n=1 Tax=Polycladidibacter hongkongensis TaxID=1647556 RepID=UPI00082DC8B6|nr:bifunctional UDP-N-acetylglucosamine diphosphorylase/glucosamine-1-phosphate N-acetyltransferase GlmU [Pseudovibrio hongkongensis]